MTTENDAARQADVRAHEDNLIAGIEQALACATEHIAAARLVDAGEWLQRAAVRLAKLRDTQQREHLVRWYALIRQAGKTRERLIAEMGERFKANAAAQQRTHERLGAVHLACPECGQAYLDHEASVEGTRIKWNCPSNNNETQS